MRLRSEAKAPFRLTRIIFLGGLAVGAALGLFIITGRLLAAVAGEAQLVGGAAGGPTREVGAGWVPEPAGAAGCRLAYGMPRDLPTFHHHT